MIIVLNKKGWNKAINLQNTNRWPGCMERFQLGWYSIWDDGFVLPLLYPHESIFILFTNKGEVNVKSIKRKEKVRCYLWCSCKSLLMPDGCGNRIRREPCLKVFDFDTQPRHFVGGCKGLYCILMYDNLSYTIFFEQLRSVLPPPRIEFV